MLFFQLTSFMIIDSLNNSGYFLVIRHKVMIQNVGPLRPTHPESCLLKGKFF